MKRVLIVTPHFPPVNAPDMHRVRQSLPHYREYGWEPTVLTVEPDAIEGYRDESLLQTVPADIEVLRTGALSTKWTRYFGVHAIGLRALGAIARAGDRFLQAKGADLVLFSTTAFPLMILGRYWRRRHRVPYMLDMQDPWYTGVEAYEGKYPFLSKAWLARRMHAVLEPMALHGASGLMAVSPAYLAALLSRYRQLREDCCRVIPFGVSARDFDVAGRPARRAGPATKTRTGFYIGASHREMWPVVELLFRAIRHGRNRGLPGFDGLSLEFAGTNYAIGERVRPAILPLARECGVNDWVTETPERLPYLDTLRRLQAADFLLVFGSTTPAYVPSKLYPYAMSGRPVFALCAESSQLAQAYRQLYGKDPAVFKTLPGDEGAVASVAANLSAFLTRPAEAGTLDAQRMAAVSAAALTREQCELFDQVLAA